MISNYNRELFLLLFYKGTADKNVKYIFKKKKPSDVGFIKLNEKEQD